MKPCSPGRLKAPRGFLYQENHRPVAMILILSVEKPVDNVEKSVDNSGITC